MTPKVPFTTNYSYTHLTPLGEMTRTVTAESPRYTGEFSGSLVIATDGEVNKRNIFKKQKQPIAQFSLRAFNFSLPIPLACDIILEVTKLGEFFQFTPVGPGTVESTYPNSIPSSAYTISSSIDFNDYQFINAIASPVYPYYFEGWYDSDDNSSGLLIQTGSTLTIYSNTNTSIDHYYAHFSTEPADRVEYYAFRRDDSNPDGTTISSVYGNSDSIEMTYPFVIPSTGSMRFTQNWNQYGQFILNAIDEYGGNLYTFEGWYDGSGTLLTTSNTISVTSGSYGGTQTFIAKYQG